MKNLEQPLAQSLLNQYKFCQRMLHENDADKDYYFGQRVAVISIAVAMFGDKITGQRVPLQLDFIKNLEIIANADNQRLTEEA